MAFLNNCHFGHFYKKMAILFFGNFREKNGNFLAIFGHLIGNFPEGQVTRAGYWLDIKKKSQVFGNFLTFNWQFS